MPNIPDAEHLDQLRQQLGLLQSELARLQKEQQIFNTNSAIGFYGTGIAQMTEGASDIVLNVGGFVYGGVHQKIQEYADVAKTAAGQLSAGDYSAVAIDQAARILEDKFREEVLALKTIVNVADSDKSTAEKVIDAAGDIGSYLKDEALESAAGIVSGANQMRDGIKTIKEGQRYRQEMNQAFERRKAELQEKANRLQQRITGAGNMAAGSFPTAPEFQPVLERIKGHVDQLVANIP